MFNSAGLAALTLFNGRVGDHNDRAMRGAPMISAGLARELGLDAVVVGSPEPFLSLGWEPELAEALPSLRAMAARYEQIFADGRVPVTALSRCAVSLATLPVVARFHPDAVVLWLDAHADLNTPSNTTTGYLGGLALSGAAGLWDSGLGGDLDTANIVLVGTRDIDPAEQDLIDQGAVRLVRVGPTLVHDLAEAIGTRPVYFHLDCDVLEPGIVPTDYHVPGGLSLRDLRGVAELLATMKVVGVEIGEFETARDATEAPANPAALLNSLGPLIAAAQHPAST